MPILHPFGERGSLRLDWSAQIYLWARWPSALSAVDSGFFIGQCRLEGLVFDGLESEVRFGMFLVLP